MSKKISLLFLLATIILFKPIPTNTGGAEGFWYSPYCTDIELDDTLSGWPTRTIIEITQKYSYTHPALDLRATIGTPIFSVGSGIVIESKCSRTGYGCRVAIRHQNGWQTLYAHMHRLPEVTVGEFVQDGQLLGISGNTGNSSGAHIHFETIKDYCYVDPSFLLR